MIYEAEGGGVGAGGRLPLGSPTPGSGARLPSPVPPEDTYRRPRGPDEGRNNGPALSAHHPDTISAPQRSMMIGSKMTRIGFHLRASDGRTTKVRGSQPPPSLLHPTPPRPLPPPPRCSLGFQLLIGRHLIRTPRSIDFMWELTGPPATAPSAWESAAT